MRYLTLTALLLVLLLVCGCSYYLYKEEQKSNKPAESLQSIPSPQPSYDAREGEPVTPADIQLYIEFELEHICGSSNSYRQLLEKYKLSGERIEEITSSPLYTGDVKKQIILRAQEGCPEENN